MRIMQPNRADAWALLTEYTKGESLLKHAMAVEAAVRGYARKFNEDEEAWGVTALLHDFDYEMHPRAPHHPLKGAEILAARGLPADVVYAILAHADYAGTPRVSLLDRALYACDELTGFVTAVALVRPNKSIFEVEPPAVRKKMKDKAFARQVNRDDIINGADQLGVELDPHIAEVIEALRENADALGLRGTFEG